MIFYLSLYFIAVFFLFCGFDRNCLIISNKIIYWIFGFILLCLAGFRYGIETDYWNYYRIFTWRYDPGLDPGWIYLQEFYKTYISKTSYNGFVFLIALISVSAKIIFFRNLKFPFLALAIYIPLFYIMCEYNGLRQGMAISFIYFAIVFARQRRTILFIFFILIASSIHISSLVFLPVYFLCRRELTIHISLVLILMVLALCMRLFLFEHVIGAILALGNMFINQSVFVYTEKLTGRLGGESISLFNIGFIRRSVVILLFILLNNQKRINNHYFYLYLIGYMIYTVFMGVGVISIRLSMSFEAFMVPMFASIPLKLNYKTFYIISVFLVLLLLLYITSLRNGNAIPYQTHLF